MKTNLFRAGRLTCLILLLAFSAAATAQEFEQVKFKTFSKDKKVFPKDLTGAPVNLVFLAMSSDQDNGQLQQEQLLEWHQTLEAQGVFTDQVVPWHFPVLESPPFFVKGIISGAMSDAYEPVVDLERAGILYVDDLPDFASAAGLELDEQPTIVIADANFVPQQSFKGEATEETVAAVIAALTAN